MKKNLLFILASVFVLTSNISQAAKIKVTTANDVISKDGLCSLREAIINTNANVNIHLDCRPKVRFIPYGNDTIELPAGAYCLSITGSSEDAALTGDLDITDNLTIIGATTASGLPLSIIDGGHGASTVCAAQLKDRIIHIDGTGSEVVQLSNLMITGGEQSGGGGGIYVADANLSLTNGAVLENTGRVGGIYAYNSEVTLTASTLSKNTSTAYGGGVYAYQSAVTLDESTVSDNTAKTYGGGLSLYGSSSSATLNSSTVSGNTAQTDGGGLYVDGSSSTTVTLNNSTLSDNTAITEGGAVYIEDGAVTLNNSTVSDNTAQTDGGGFYIDGAASKAILNNSTLSGNTATVNGGGLYIDKSAKVTTLNNSTISGNTATVDGGGLYLEANVYFDPYSSTSSSAKLIRPTVEVKNTIVSGNTAGQGPECYEQPASSTYISTSGSGFLSYGYNFIAYAADNCSASYSVGIDATFDVIDKSSTDLLLDVLADNGGETYTHALQAGSPALDQSDCTTIDGDVVATDQRGEIRPSTACDIGAYEYY